MLSFHFKEEVILMGEYTVTFKAKEWHEPIHEAVGFAEWYDNTDPEDRLEEAVKLGFIEAQRGDDDYFLELVLKAARDMNYGPAWIKEIMRLERKSDNMHRDIAEDAEEMGACLEQVLDAYELHLTLLNCEIGRENDDPVDEETIKALEEAVSGL